MRFDWSLAFVVMLAGCTGPAPEAPHEGPPAPGPETSSPAPGDEQEEGRQARADWVGAEQGGSEPVDITWDGAMEPEVCAPSGPNSCTGFSQALASKGDVLLVEAPPATWSGSLVLTWTASSPATEAVQLRFAFYESCGNACWESVGGAFSVAGTSPLTLELQEATTPALAEGMWISVDEVRLTPDPVYAIVSPGQDFHLEGRLLPAPTPSA